MAVKGLGRKGTEDRRAGRRPLREYRAVEGSKAIIAIIAKI